MYMGYVVLELKQCSPQKLESYSGYLMQKTIRKNPPNPKPLNPKPLNPKPLNPKPLHPKTLKPKAQNLQDHHQDAVDVRVPELEQSEASDASKSPEAHG